MKLLQLQEARYHGEHPFVAEFFRNLFDADALSKTRYPKEIEFDTWNEALTSRYGEPQNRSDSRHLEWVVDLPNHLVREYDMDKMYIYLHRQNNMIEIMWE